MSASLPSPASEPSATTEIAAAQADESSIKSSRVLAGEKVSFTGTLASLTHQQAFEIVRQHDGEPSHHLTKQSTLLVIGEEGWPLEQNGEPSLKLEQAIQLRTSGQPLRIIKESVWLAMLNLTMQDGDKETDVKRFYTPAALSQLLDVSVVQIRQWERLGLIRATQKIFRLPYFNFHEVTKARNIANLLKAGNSIQEIARSLQALEQMYLTADMPLDAALVRIDKRLFAKDNFSLVDLKTRQRHFNFDAEAAPPALNLLKEDDSEDFVSLSCEQFTSIPLDDQLAPQRVIPDWYIEGCRLLEDDRLEEASRAFHEALRRKPDDVDVHFSLADTLYRMGRPHAAIERFLCVIENDPEFLEAWTQLGCLYVELKQPQDALDAFQQALDLHPDYADAHLHKAQIHQQLGDDGLASQHWSQYLDLEPDGIFADVARQALGLDLSV
ncbi:tetratricopeptide repeat protein [Lacunimicrobium album]